MPVRLELLTGRLISIQFESFTWRCLRMPDTPERIAECPITDCWMVCCNAETTNAR
jgi:hypothetical protein